MHRMLFVLCCIASALPAQETRARIGFPGFQDVFPIEDVASSFDLDAPVGKAYAAIKATFAELKVPLEGEDSVRGIVGNRKISARTNFAGYRLSRVLDCGTGGTGGQNADSFQLHIALIALLDPAGGSHTRVRVGFVAGAAPVAGDARNAVQCGSTGVLEARLIELASKHLK